MLLAAATLLGGCIGTSESASLSCPYPDAIACESLSSVYDRTAGVHEQLPEPVLAPDADAAAQSAGWPAVRAARVLRVWLAPWQDADGDLHGAQEIYMLIERARWQDPQSGLQMQDAASAQ
ncbi:MAG: TraV family lipoprotein [Betaproteobacteria bacterium]|nr:TraV family lipoprotein [Betaproteobacteria bacterium]